MQIKNVRRASSSEAMRFFIVGLVAGLVAAEARAEPVVFDAAVAYDLGDENGVQTADWLEGELEQLVPTDEASSESEEEPAQERWWVGRDEALTVVVDCGDEATLAAALAYLEQQGVGDEEVKVLSLSPILILELGAAELDALTDYDFSLRIADGSAAPTPHLAYTGYEIALSTKTDFMDYGVDGFSGDTGNIITHTSPVRVAIIEAEFSPEEGTADLLASNHVGFKTAAGVSGGAGQHFRRPRSKFPDDNRNGT